MRKVVPFPRLSHIYLSVHVLPQFDLFMIIFPRLYKCVQVYAMSYFRHKQALCGHSLDGLFVHIIIITEKKSWVAEKNVAR